MCVDVGFLIYIFYKASKNIKIKRMVYSENGADKNKNTMNTCIPFSKLFFLDFICFSNNRVIHSIHSFILTLFTCIFSILVCSSFIFLQFIFLVFHICFLKLRIRLRVSYKVSIYPTCIVIYFYV